MRQYGKGGTDGAGQEKHKRHEELDERADGHASKDPSAPGGTRRRRPQDLGARGSLRIRQLVVGFHDQQTPQRDHRRQPEHASKETERNHLQIGRNHPPEEKGRDGVNRPGGQRRGCRADRLRDVGFEDAAFGAEEFEDRHGHHRGGNRGGNGQSDAQTEICVRGPENNAEHDPGRDRLESEFRKRWRTRGGHRPDS